MEVTELINSYKNKLNFWVKLVVMVILLEVLPREISIKNVDIF